MNDNARNWREALLRLHVSKERSNTRLQELWIELEELLHVTKSLDVESVRI